MTVEPAATASSSADTAAKLLAAAHEALQSSQYLLAFDEASRGLALQPQNLELRFEAVKALIELRSLDEARRLLDEARGSVGFDDAALERIAGTARAAAKAKLGEGPPAPSPIASGPALLAAPKAQEALGLAGRLLKESYRQTNAAPDARKCKQAYLAAFAASGGYWTCINVATLARILAARDPARALEETADARLFARMSIRLCDEAGETFGAAAAGNDKERFWLAATRGEAKLLLSDPPGAAAAYAEAAGCAGVTDAMRESARRQLRLLADHGVPIPPAVRDLFRPPAVVCFSGHMIDAPGRAEPRFPPLIEQDVRREIARAIDALAAPKLIGYCSAACGGDILFAELMLERGAELEIILPFEESDFRQTSVAFAGPEWERRYEQVTAGRVTYGTTEPYLGTDALFGHCNRVLAGAAWLRAESFGVEPHLIVAADPATAPGGQFGAAQMIDLWPRNRSTVVDIGRIRAAAGASGAVPSTGSGSVATAPAASSPIVQSTDSGVPQPMPPIQPSAVSGEAAAFGLAAALTIIPGVSRVADGSEYGAWSREDGSSQIAPSSLVDPLPSSAAAHGDKLYIDGQPVSRDVKALLFADVRGFSGLTHTQMPLFMYRFVRRVAEAWAVTPAAQPLLLQTWGDAFYCVMPTALDAVWYARALQQVTAATIWAELGLPAELPVRVSLHAGPVFEGTHPMTHDRNFFGTQVTRAARIEPITQPGHVYASFPFVALLTAEQAATRPPPGGWPFRCAYVGQIKLPKEYGMEALYDVKVW